MKNIILLPILLFFCNALQSQPKYIDDFFYNTTDTSLIMLPVELPYILAKEDIYVFDSKRDLKVFADTNSLSTPWSGGEGDEDKYTYALINYSGTDCHSSFRFSLNRNDSAKLYVIDLFIIYGGCRAGGRSYSKWVKMPKLPEGYRVVFLQSSD